MDKRLAIGLGAATVVFMACLPVYTNHPASASASATRPSPLVTAFQAAKQQGAPIEVESARTERSTSWALPNGLLRTELSSGPIRVKKNGAWIPIDTTLERRGGMLKPRAAKADIEIAGDGGDVLATLHHGKNKSFGVRWAKKLPVPDVSGSTATYRDVVPGGDLVVTALPTGITHDVILRERPTGPVEIPMPLALTGLKFGKDKNGRLRLDDSYDNLFASAPEPQMWDAEAEASPDAGRRMPVTTEIIKGKGGPALVLKPDSAFLADPATKYPVTIDPWTTLAIKTDTFVSSDYTTGQSGSTWLHAGKFGSGTKTARSYLKFDTASILGSQIANADLRLWNYKSNACGSSVGSGIQVRRITAYWKSADLAMTNQPPTTAEDAVTLKTAAGEPGCAAGELFYSIEGIVRAWAAGQPGYGVQLRAANESDTTNWRMFYSSENSDAAHRPKLVIDHQPRATAAEVSAGAIHLRWAPHTGASQYIVEDDNEQTELWRGTATTLDLPVQAPAYRSLVVKAVTSTGPRDVAKFLVTVPEPESGQAPLTVATTTTKSILNWKEPATSTSVEEEYRLTDVAQNTITLPEPIAQVSTALGESGNFQVESGPVTPDETAPGDLPADVEPEPDPSPDESGEGNGETDPYTPPPVEAPSTEPETLLYGVEITPAVTEEPLARAAAARTLTQSWTTYEAYIPWGWLDAPELGGRYFTCEGGADWWYKGDNRGIGFNTGKYRTRAAVKYDWANRRNNTYKSVQSTHRYKRLSNGSLQYNSKRTASASGFHVRSISNNGRYGRTVIEHNVGNPYCSPVADISYASQQDLYQNGKHWLYGTHDKMPTHEMYRQNIYSDGTKTVSRIFTHKLKNANCLVPAYPGCGKWKYQYVK